MARWLIGLLAVAGCDYLWDLKSFPPANGDATTGDTLAGGPIAFVQRADQASSTRIVIATFPTHLTAGDLVVVIIGWTGANGIEYVIDGAGNSYRALSTPSSFQGLSQVLYYAENVMPHSGATDAVMVGFAALPIAGDIRALEYRGIAHSMSLDPGASVAAIGTSATPMGQLTTTADNVLLVVGVTATTVTTAGSGYIERSSDGTQGRLAEDKVAAKAAPYTATAMQATAGNYVLHVAGFKGQ